MLGPDYYHDGSSLSSTSPPASSSLTPKPVFAVTPPTPHDVSGFSTQWLDLAATAATSFYTQQPPPPSPALVGSPSTGINNALHSRNTPPESTKESPANRPFNRNRKRTHDNITSPQPSFRQSVGKKRSLREIPRSDTGEAIIANNNSSSGIYQEHRCGTWGRDYAMSVASQGQVDEKSRVVPNAYFPDIPKILPHEKVFPIQIGGELFRLSGASISSDAPSYFSQFFEQQLAGLGKGETVRTLYIDRDPITFRDIARHLQGYHVSPKDGQHFVRLFADAQFYSLPKLISQLFESEIFISIGSRPFQINRDLFQSPGNSPNYFSLGFAVFFSSPNEVFPGLSREGLLRPPSILPPEVPNRSADVFAELLHLLRGYPVHIRNEEHRQELLRDCKYFHLKGLEQKLIPHEISWNQKRQRQEIVIRLEDIKPSGIAFSPDGGPGDQFPGKQSSGWINYMRPFVDDTQRELIVEIGGEQTKVDWRSGRAEFTGTTNQRVSALFQVIANKLGLPVGHERALGLVLLGQNGINGSGPGSSGPASPGNTPLSEDRVKIKVGPDCYIRLDGEECWDRDGMGAFESHESHDAVVEAGPPGSDAGRSVGGTPSPGLNWQHGTSRPASTKSFLGVQGQSGSRKRYKRRGSMEEGGGEWIVKRGQWRIRVQTTTGLDGRSGMEVVLVGVKLDAFSGEYGRNAQRGFLI